MSTAPRAEIQIGYPDFWPVVYQKHQKFCDVANGLGPIMDDLFSQAHSETLHKVCRQLSKMIANSFSAVLMLGMNGFGHDAIKIARTMFETMVTVAYLLKHPEELEDYMDFHFIVAMKRHRYMEKYTPERLKEVTPEAIESTKQGYARVVSRFTGKRGVRGRWSKKPFGELCTDLGLKEHHLAFYAMASNFTHADVSGMMAQADPEPGVLDADIAPSERFVDMAFRTAHFAFVVSACEYVANVRPDKKPLADRIESDFVAAWKD
jgi:hypothetical protein